MQLKHLQRLMKQLLLPRLLHSDFIAAAGGWMTPRQLTHAASALTSRNLLVKV